MPNIRTFGRFCMIDSRASKWRPYDRHIGIVELHEPIALDEIWTYHSGHDKYVPARGVPWKLDPRLKCIKRIVWTWDLHMKYHPHSAHRNRKTYWLYRRTMEKAHEMAERWDKLYPLHIVAKDWPLPLPVYPEL